MQLLYLLISGDIALASASGDSLHWSRRVFLGSSHSSGTIDQESEVEKKNNEDKQFSKTP